MASQADRPNLLRKAEDLISRLRDIRSCSISSNDDGEITEIHVVAQTERPPKLVARDVESALRAELGLTVDYKKIGISLMQDDEKEKVAPLYLEELEEDVRLRFEGVNLLVSSDTVEAEVELSRSGVHVHGKAKGRNTKHKTMTVIGEATLNAISDLIPDFPQLDLADVKRVRVADQEAVLVCVHVREGRRHKSLIGTAFVDEDINQTVLFATLDALNRLLGRFRARAPRKYEIK